MAATFDITSLFNKTASNLTQSDLALLLVYRQKEEQTASEQQAQRAARAEKKVLREQRKRQRESEPTPQYDATRQGYGLCQKLRRKVVFDIQTTKFCAKRPGTKVISGLYKDPETGQEYKVNSFGKVNVTENGPKKKKQKTATTTPAEEEQQANSEPEETNDNDTFRQDVDIRAASASIPTPSKTNDEDE